MKILFKICVVIILFSSQQCTTVKRYKAINSVENNNDLVSIDLFGTKIDSQDPTDDFKTLWQLSGEGQQELIKALDKRFTDADKFTQSLNTKYLEGEEKPVADFTNKSLKMVFSISKTHNFSDILSNTSTFSLADRIEYLKFSIELPNEINVNFVKWNKFSTEYATVDVADITFAESVEINGSLGQSANSTKSTKSGNDDSNNNTTGSSTTVTPSISGKGNFSKTENQKIRYRYVQLNGNLSDKKIVMEEEGMREIDLSGNVLADVYLKFDATSKVLFTAKNTLDKDGNFNKPDKVLTTLLRVNIPDLTTIPTSLKGTLHCDYVYRHVVKGEKTFYEWDDEITYYHGSFVKQINLLKRSDFIPGFFTIGLKGEDQKNPEDRTEIKLIDTDTNTEYPLLFNNIDAGRNFLKWLKKYPVDAAQKNEAIVTKPYKFILTKEGINQPLTRKTIEIHNDDLMVLQYFR